VRPRLETALGVEPVSEGLLALGERRPFGIAELDQMLLGGVRTGSVTMLLGASGVGKTLLGMQFLAEGLKRGERGLYFGFFERPDAILAKCRRIGLNGINEGVSRGLARLTWHRPVEGIIDELGASLLEAVSTLQPERLVIDGMQGFERAADFGERLPHVYSAIAQDLERRRITTLYTSETHALFAPDIEVPISGLSAATQNIFVLRHVEHRARMIRALAILKVRDSDYDNRIRELRITDEGIVLLDTLATERHIVTGGGAASAGRPLDPTEEGE
jgi:circadian clock protein KaiC